MKLYHKTDVKNVASILREGLICDYAHYSPRIYLCRFPDMDMGLGRALFEVDIPDDDPELNLKDGDDDWWQFISWKDIPPEWIIYLGEYGPNQKPAHL